MKFISHLLDRKTFIAINFPQFKFPSRYIIRIYARAACSDSYATWRRSDFVVRFVS